MSPAAQDQSVLESQNIRAVGFSGGSVSSEPAGITAIPNSVAIRGNGLPQDLQNDVRKRLAPGTLYPPRLSSPAVHFTSSSLSSTLLAWPVPLDLRQRRQWRVRVCG